MVVRKKTLRLLSQFGKIMNSTNVACANCRRVGSDLVVRQYSRRLLSHKHSRPYYALPNLTAAETRTRRCMGADALKIWLCGCCDRHLLENSNDASDYWPAMIYKFLVHKNSKHSAKVSFHQKWKLIPTKWRHWWENEFRHYGIEGIGAIFVDVSEELKEVNEAIEKLEWVPLAKCMDRHFAYPEVSAIRKQGNRPRSFLI